MSVEENKALSRRTFEEIWNQGNLAAIDALYAADQVSHGLGMDVPPGVAGLKQFVASYRTAYPDTHFTVEDQIAEGDKVATRWSAAGTRPWGTDGHSCDRQAGDGDRDCHYAHRWRQDCGNLEQL